MVNMSPKVDSSAPYMLTAWDGRLSSRSWLKNQPIDFPNSSFLNLQEVFALLCFVFLYVYVF